ncbi:hypothetical protein HYV79_05380 [Candidatus Woesearchaeota archaeon]|nr:hypothetical protein [Candidatus Woesearchaeota archaeon]
MQQEQLTLDSFLEETELQKQILKSKIQELIPVNAYQSSCLSQIKQIYSSQTKFDYFLQLISRFKATIKSIILRGKTPYQAHQQYLFKLDCFEDSYDNTNFCLEKDLEELCKQESAQEIHKARNAYNDFNGVYNRAKNVLQKHRELVEESYNLFYKPC